MHAVILTNAVNSLFTNSVIDLRGFVAFLWRSDPTVLDDLSTSDALNGTVVTRNDDVLDECVMKGTFPWSSENFVNDA